MKELKARRKNGYFGGLFLGIGRQSCQDYLTELQAYKAVLDSEIEASNQSVGLAKEVADLETKITLNDETISTYATYSKEKQKLIRSAGNDSRKAIKDARKEKSKSEKKVEALCNLQETLISQIK